VTLEIAGLFSKPNSLSLFLLSSIQPHIKLCMTKYLNLPMQRSAAEHCAKGKNSEEMRTPPL